MRTIEYTSRFKKDYKREKRSHRSEASFDKNFLSVVSLLAKDEKLSKKFYDHALLGKWSDHRDCHIKPDLVLIYRKPTQSSLELVRLGSHAELGM
tara:strand:+ start:41454 stop:41738 length:285 start_codon:yes stop_codon:yes gene_type:complete